MMTMMYVIDEDDGDGSTSSGSSATSSGTGRYDNTGGFGYREHTELTAVTERSADHPHICDRHYRRMQYGGGDNDDGRGDMVDHAAFAFRPEHDASNEGIVTSTLAQLENIVKTHKSENAQVDAEEKNSAGGITDGLPRM